MKIHSTYLCLFSTGTALKGLVPAVEPSLIHPISRKLCCKCCRQRVMNANEALKYVPIEDRQKKVGQILPGPTWLHWWLWTRFC